MARAKGAILAATVLMRVTRTGAALLGGFGAACILPMSGLSAQSDRQGQSVAERNAPEFSNVPVEVGGFQLFPSIALDVEYNDNVFAVNNNANDDFILSVNPNVLMVDRRPDRETRINLSAGLRRYAETTSENAGQFALDATTRQGIGTGFEYNLGVSVRRANEQRRDIDAFDVVTAQPVSFTNIRAEAGVAKEFGPFGLSARGSARAVRYQGEITSGGSEFDLAFRDFETYRGTARASFARSRNQRFYVQAQVDQRDAQLAPLFEENQVIGFVDRSSSGVRIEAGYGQQITELLYLDVRAGYLKQNFDDPTLDTIEGLAFEADLLWNVTPLTSVLFSAVRRVDETINPQFSGLLRTEARIQVEHELLRNLVLTGRLGYANLELGNSAADGRRWNAGLFVDYRLNRHWSFLLEGQYFDRTGLNEFTQNSILLSVRYSF